MQKSKSIAVSSNPQTMNSDVVSRTPFYYGWVILVVATFGMIMSSPGQTYAVSIFIEHFIQELGISRSLISTLYTVGTLASSFTLPWIGRQIDHRGARLMMFTTAIIFGLVCIYMGFVLNAIMLGIGFFLLRMLGQGSLSLVCSNVINQWWVQKRGPLLGISGVVSATLGLGAVPIVIHYLIPELGWRNTYMVLGLALLVVLAPISYFFIRNRPEDHGLLPDGIKAEAQSDAQDGEPKANAPQPVAEENWTRSEAMRTPIFWVFLLGLSSIASLGTGLTFHIVSIFEDSGMSATLAATAFGPIAVTMAITNLASGFLVDRMRLRTLMSLGLLFQASSLWLVSYLSNTTMAILFGIIMGITFGLMRTVHVVSWAKYYGRLHLGSITGVTATVTSAASALGPMPMGLARDALGSYGPTLMVLSVIPLVLAVVCLFVDRPQKSTP
ncbi:MAG: MFS transporter [Chloroflexota bacterium]